MTSGHTENVKADPGTCLFLMLIVCFCDCVDVIVWKGCLCVGCYCVRGVCVSVCVYGRGVLGMCWCVCVGGEHVCLYVWVSMFVWVRMSVWGYLGVVLWLCVCFLCFLICFFPLLFIFGLFVSICLPNFLVWLVGLICFFFFFLKRERKRG